MLIQKVTAGKGSDVSTSHLLTGHVKRNLYPFSARNVFSLYLILLGPHTLGSRCSEIIRFGDETQFSSFLYQYCVHFFPFRYCYL